MWLEQCNFFFFDCATKYRKAERAKHRGLGNSNRSECLCEWKNARSNGDQAWGRGGGLCLRGRSASNGKMYIRRREGYMARRWHKSVLYHCLRCCDLSLSHCTMNSGRGLEIWKTRLKAISWNHQQLPRRRLWREEGGGGGF
jgi:hypothetical protein